VKNALEPALARIGDDARPEAVLDLKVCDPAMGSGAFLVEACRTLGERLVQAWTRWPETRPTIPSDEDEYLRLLPHSVRARSSFLQASLKCLSVLGN
jgi:hypothetical protein